MRNKKTFSFDEERDAENIIKEGFSGSIDYSKMYTVAKYFREKLGYGETRLERELIKFCISNDPNFNPVTEAESIKKWIKSALKYGLRKVDSIFISQADIDFLQSIYSDKDRRVLFSILVMAKALKNSSTRKASKPSESKAYYIRYINFMDIIRMSNVKGVTEVGLALIFNKYKELFFFYPPEKELIQVLFISDETNDVEIKNLSNPLEDYTEIFHNQDYCHICGKPITKNSNRQKTCTECVKRLSREKSARWRMRKKLEENNLINSNSD